MKLKPLIITTLCLAAAPLFGQEDSPVKATKSKLDKWVETQQLISEEKNDWTAEQASLADTKELLQKQLEALNEKINELEDTATQADSERNDLLLERAAYMRANKSLADVVTGLEQRLVAQTAYYPQPLLDIVEPLLVRIPENPEETDASLGQRVQNIVGILSQAQKFNNSITFIGETQAVAGSDKQVQVWTFYWGLGAAFYVDELGQVGGIGVPTKDGWVFTQDDSIAARVGKMRAYYENTDQDIKFVPVPVTIQ
ncbi:MAG: DUF3450 family protein [Verrucomicrobiota bacterium JB024]|jgi:gas vesicle protein|nr:DUF3450 family protein [Verrucomicrobiota bacterium JB024]